MPVTLSIKNAPDDVVRRLRDRAARNHRSLQGELLAIIEAAVTPSGASTASELLGKLRASGLSTPREAADLIRADRDGRKGR